jgi:hypothetical protein
MVRAAHQDSGPSWVEVLFKLAAVGVMTLLASVYVIPFAGLLLLSLVAPDASLAVAFDVGFACLLLALGVTCATMVWSVLSDLKDRRGR